MIVVDYLVIGSGISGLTFALKMSQEFPDRSIAIITKSDELESNTKYAQGGIASVFDTDKDSFKKHIADTLIAGDGLCDPHVVKMVIEEGPQRVGELIEWGTEFDTDHSGNLELGREGGHSHSRIIHHKDKTGHEIELALLRRVRQHRNIRIYQHHFAIDLITEHHLLAIVPSTLTCFGAYVLNRKSGQILTFRAKATVLSTGGIGVIYGHTTNPPIATGDGIAMAYRAKALIKDMEFVQFHPTVLYDETKGQSFLISEAVRGFGAHLRNAEGHRFMPGYDLRAELAPRDIVSRSIDQELKRSGDTHVFMDCTHLDPKAFKAQFPTIYKECRSRSIKVEKDWIPVVPAAHYLCGGIVVDTDGRTTIKNLFACGECSRTGLHGSNRLASNSLLEALVYAHRSYRYLGSQDMPDESRELPEWDETGTALSEEKLLIRHNTLRLQALMQDYVGIVRSTARLQKAVNHLNVMYREIEDVYRGTKANVGLCEVRNMINVAHLIISQSLERSENRGVFYKVDPDSSKKNK